MAWSDLPVDLLRCISSLVPIGDILRFSVVCISWNSALANKSYFPIQCRPSPWLLLPKDARETSDTLTFRDLTIEDSRGNHHRFSSHSILISDHHYIGSKDGWLVTLDNKDLRPRLFNPLTKAEMSLPSLSTIPRNNVKSSERLSNVYFQKIVLSSINPSGTAVVFYRYKKSLALARPGDRAWVLGPPLPPYILKHEEFEDVYFNEEEQMFYVITHFSAVLSFNLNGQNVKLICRAIQKPYLKNRFYRNYIAFLSGNLIKIERHFFDIQFAPDNICTIKTDKINVLKFVPADLASSCSYSQWIPIKDLEDCSLFIGYNHTFSIHHTIVPEIRSNCIYFSDYWDQFDCDTGLFDLHNNCVQYFLDSDLSPKWPPSIWFTPSFP